MEDYATTKDSRYRIKRSSSTFLNCMLGLHLSTGYKEAMPGLQSPSEGDTFMDLAQSLQPKTMTTAAS